MAIQLRPPPRTDDIREIKRWTEELYRKLTEGGALSWTNVDKAGSNITDIQTRPHASLSSVGEIDVTSTNATKDKHVSNLLGKGWEDHRTSHNPPGVAVADASASAVAVTSPDATGTYGVGEQTLINELKADVNQLVTDVNAAIIQLNGVLASLRTITIINT